MQCHMPVNMHTLDVARYYSYTTDGPNRELSPSLIVAAVDFARLYTNLL